MSKVLIIATSRKTRGGITSVIKVHENGIQWKKYHCHWIQTHKDGFILNKILYLVTAWLQFIVLIPFYDIIHVHGTGDSSAKRKEPFIRIAKKLKKKVIFHFHPSSENVLYDKDCYILEKIFSAADMILVLSPSWEKEINKAFPNNKYNISVLWNPCPDIHRDMNVKKKQILFAGSVIERKGYVILLKAFSLIANKARDWKLVFAGNGEIEKAKQIADKLGVSEQVEWLGWVKGGQKNKVFQESSIYCLSSYGEGFPMGVLDAWAYGIPCVVTPVGGIPDIVTDGVNGLIFPIGDEKVLSEKLQELISNEDLRNSIVQESDKLVNTIFSSRYVCQQLDKIYYSLSKLK